MKKLVLVSSSPRRYELLSRVGLNFELYLPSVSDESVDCDDPSEYVKRVASLKLAQLKPEHDKVYSAFDTIVFIDGKILSKPADENEAKQMLKLLSGRWHEVFTGIALMDENLTLTDFERTRVKFYELSDAEIEAYISTGEPMDKAGAYGIQEKGALLVERIDGCYFNVVGLPLPKLARLLANFGVHLKEMLSYGR